MLQIIHYFSFILNEILNFYDINDFESINIKKIISEKIQNLKKILKKFKVSIRIFIIYLNFIMIKVIISVERLE